MMRWFRNRAEEDSAARLQRNREACEQKAARRKEAEGRTWTNAFILLRRAHRRRFVRKARQQLEFLSARLRDPPP